MYLELINQGLKFINNLFENFAKPIKNFFKKREMIKSLSYVKEESKKFKEDCKEANSEIDELLEKKSDYIGHIFAKRLELDSEYINQSFKIRNFENIDKIFSNSKIITSLEKLNQLFNDYNKYKDSFLKKTDLLWEEDYQEWMIDFFYQYESIIWKIEEIENEFFYIKKINKKIINPIQKWYRRSKRKNQSKEEKENENEKVIS